MSLKSIIYSPCHFGNQILDLSILEPLEKICQNLNELSFSVCNESSIETNGFELFKNLTDLKLSGQIKSIKPDCFYHLNNLISLDLCRCNIEYLDNLELNSSFLINLKSLNLSGNQLKLIKSNFLNRLTNLKTLFLNNSNITVIEKNAFNGLDNLNQLNLSANKINLKNGCGIFHNLINLKVLHLQDCSLSNNMNIDTFSGLDNLVYLNLKMNNLKGYNFDSMFKMLTNLKHVNL